MPQIQALTWQAQAPKQQDAILLAFADTAKLLQDKAALSSVYTPDGTQDYLLAVSDGIASNPNSGAVSKAVLKNLYKGFCANAINFDTIQQALVDKFVHLAYLGAGATLAMVRYTAPDKGCSEIELSFEIRHLGDSQVYRFVDKIGEWQALTTNHTYLNELKQEVSLDPTQQYASFYDVLYHYFCVDSEHRLTPFEPTVVALAPNDALLICSDGVHDVLPCSQWTNPNELFISDWLKHTQSTLMKQKAWDNVSMILLKSH